MAEKTAQGAVFLNECVRNLNRRTARLERFALLVSVDSLTLFSPLANDPPGHHSDRSPSDVVRDSSTALGMTHCPVAAAFTIMNCEL